ncbi:hypothetical protein DNTS_027306 [Danionella cerebrum]|uniref:Uncharacterized protein n=1 Tax=Danionella cerebrum TaxID=2873325 RepID=A0A553QVS3_9TELE|nr:hypothetical protein DNTS_027306 [Danionella translucida]
MEAAYLHEGSSGSLLLASRSCPLVADAYLHKFNAAYLQEWYPASRLHACTNVVPYFRAARLQKCSWVLGAYLHKWYTGSSCLSPKVVLWLQAAYLQEWFTVVHRRTPKDKTGNCDSEEKDAQNNPSAQTGQKIAAGTSCDPFTITARQISTRKHQKDKKRCFSVCCGFDSSWGLASTLKAFPFTTHEPLFALFIPSSCLPLVLCSSLLPSAHDRAQLAEQSKMTENSFPFFISFNSGRASLLPGDGLYRSHRGAVRWPEDCRDTQRQLITGCLQEKSGYLLTLENLEDTKYMQGKQMSLKRPCGVCGRLCEHTLCMLTVNRKQFIHNPSYLVSITIMFSPMKAVTRHMGIPVLAEAPMRPMIVTHMATISSALPAMIPEACVCCSDERTGLEREDLHPEGTRDDRTIGVVVRSRSRPIQHRHHVFLILCPGSMSTEQNHTSSEKQTRSHPSNVQRLTKFSPLGIN